MTYEELLTRGRALTESERGEALRKLLKRDEAPALIAWLEDTIKQQGYVEHIGRQDLADRKGSLESIAGSIGAVTKIQEELQQLLAPRPARMAAPHRDL